MIKISFFFYNKYLLKKCPHNLNLSLMIIKMKAKLPKNLFKIFVEILKKEISAYPNSSNMVSYSMVRLELEKQLQVICSVAML